MGLDLIEGSEKPETLEKKRFRNRAPPSPVSIKVGSGNGRDRDTPTGSNTDFHGGWGEGAPN